MAAIIKGQTLTFGTGTTPNLITSATVNRNSSKKEIANGSGGFGAVVYYAVKDEINIETYAADDADAGDEYTLPGLISSYVQGLVIITGADSIQSAEDMTKRTLTAVAYAQID